MWVLPPEGDVMNASKLVAVTMATLLLIGAGAAVGAAAPADQVNSTDTPTDADNATEDSDDDASVGPSDGMPEQAPDHVSQIHDRIESFLNGEIEDLGASLSELLANDDAADDEPGQSANAGESGA